VLRSGEEFVLRKGGRFVGNRELKRPLLERAEQEAARGINMIESKVVGVLGEEVTRKLKDKLKRKLKYYILGATLGETGEWMADPEGEFKKWLGNTLFGDDNEGGDVLKRDRNGNWVLNPTFISSGLPRFYDDPANFITPFDDDDNEVPNKEVFIDEPSVSLCPPGYYYDDEFEMCEKMEENPIFF
jgi:hypothetical protein